MEYNNIILIPNTKKAAPVAVFPEFFELFKSNTVPIIPNMTPTKCVNALVFSFLSVVVITPPCSFDNYIM